MRLTLTVRCDSDQLWNCIDIEYYDHQRANYRSLYHVETYDPQMLACRLQAACSELAAHAVDLGVAEALG